MRGIVIAWLLAVLPLASCGPRFQSRLIYPRDRAEVDPAPLTEDPTIERWWLATAEGRVEAWLLPGDGVSAEHPGPAVVYAHGNSSVIDQYPEQLRAYRRAGVSVLLPEYRGYGRSEGTPRERKIREDLVCFHDRLASRPEVDPERIAFHGRSLGGGVVVALASRRRPAALILESTFVSLPAMTSHYLVPSDFLMDQYESHEVLPDLDVPVLILHGLDDAVIPFKHARYLRSIAPDARGVAFPEAGHTDLPSDPERYWGAILGFLEDELGQRRESRAARVAGSTRRTLRLNVPR